MRTIALLMTLLISGCQTKIICKEIKRSEIRPLPFCDMLFNKKNPEKSRCRCRCMDLNIYETVEDNKCRDKHPQFKSGNYPLEMCSQVAGAVIDEWVSDIRPNIKRLNKIKRTYCK